MNVLITGGLGYVGSILSTELKNKKFNLIGIDPFWFSASAVNSYESDYNDLYESQVSDLSDFELTTILKDVDCVVSLAAVSNDPMGNIFEKITNDVNHIQNIKLYNLAKIAGVKKFIFASSCSVYGSASRDLATENTQPNPLTAYSKSKVDFERFLSNQEDGLTKVSLRFATAAGASHCPRTDLAVNDFVYTGLSEGKIKLNSSGTSNRPFISVYDMAKAIQNFISDTSYETSEHNIFNVGTNDNNYKIIDVATEVAKLIGCEIEIENSIVDTRDYRVSFEKYNDKFPKHSFQNMDKIIKELVSQYKNIISSGRLKAEFIRLEVLKNILN